MTKMTFSSPERAKLSADRLISWAKAARVDGCVVTTNANARDRKAVAEPGMSESPSFTGYDVASSLTVLEGK